MILKPGTLTTIVKLPGYYNYALCYRKDDGQQSDYEYFHSKEEAMIKSDIMGCKYLPYKEFIVECRKKIYNWS